MRRGGQERRWMDGNIKAQVRTSILQLAEKAAEVESMPMRKSRKGGVMALRMRDSPSSSQGHTTSKSCQSAGSQERRGKHTSTHSTETLTHSLHLTCPALLSRGNSVHAYIPIPGLARLDDGKQAACYCQKAPKEHNWDAANASMHRVTGSPLSLARSLHTPFFSFTLRICLTFHFLPPSPSLSLSLSPRTHTCTLFLSLGVEQTEMHAKLKRGGGET